MEATSTGTPSILPRDRREVLEGRTVPTVGHPLGAAIALGSTIALATDRLLRPVEGMHHSISSRWFRAVGPVGAPVRLAHDTISATVYSAIRLAGLAVGAGLERTVDIRDETTDRMTAFVAGVLGDDLGTHSPAFDISMEPRSVGSPPTGRIVVLLHGLTETERIFDGDAGLRAAIDDDPALTAVSIRYHTGLPVADNGARLATLLDELVTDWPVEVQSVVLIGRSMGGLVARAACVAAQDDRLAWVGAVSDVVTIGTPHRGSWVAQLATVAERGLRVAPDTRPLAAVLADRSDGIRDLDHGARGGLPPGIDHHFVAGVVAASTRSALSGLVGDAVVGRRSATGHGLGPTSTVTVASTGHGRLHRHPDVVDAVMARASTTPPGSSDTSPRVREELA